MAEQMAGVDMEFFECILEELRDGETVFVRTSLSKSKVKAILTKLGATDEDLSRLEMER